MMIVSIFLLGAQSVCTQNSKQKVNRYKVLDTLHRANAEYESARFAKAAKDYETYLSADSSNPKTVLTMLADCYWQIRANDNALRVYQLLFQDGKEGATDNQKVRIGELYARYGMYKQATEWLQDVNGYKVKARAYSRKTKLELLKRDSLSWTLGFLNINSSYRDYFPVLFNSTLFFSSNRPLPSKGRISLWDESCYTRLRKISVDKIKTEPVNEIKSVQVFEKPKTEITISKSVARLYEGADVRDIQNELEFWDDKRYMQDIDTTSIVVEGLDRIGFNATGIAFDRNSHVYLSANYPKNKNKINRVCLLEGVYSMNKITNIHVLPFGNIKSYSVMLPTISSDGNILVFCSDKAGGKGKLDLYYAQRDTKTREWGGLKTFEGDINTVGNEVFPSIGADGYLYFSSDARPGLGGLDIYRILLQDAIDGKGEPQHLSYPINSSADDFGWTVDSTGTNGFFSSDRLNHGDDLYSFDYKPYNKVRIISGLVLDELTKEPIADATVFMLNHSTSEVTVVHTDKVGKYKFSINAADKVVVKSMKKGMSSDFLLDDAFKGTTQLEDTTTRILPDLLADKQPDSERDLADEINDSTIFSDDEGEQLNDLAMKVIENRMFAKQNFKVNNTWKLNNIYYDFDKIDLREESKPMLDSLIVMLKKLPLRVEISSHTDNRGTFEYNDLLSQRRAELVVAYLVDHGIARNRVLAKGFGKRKLLINCGDNVPCTENESQLNRRTEVKVMGYSHKEKKYKFDQDKYKDGEKIDKMALPKDFFEN